MNLSKTNGAVMENTSTVRRFQITITQDKKHEFACSPECSFLKTGESRDFCNLFRKELMPSVRRDFIYRYLECANLTSSVIDAIKQSQKIKK